MKKNIIKTLLPYLVAIVSFLLFSVLYCAPMLQGKIVNASDTNNWKGAAHQTQEYYEQTGEYSWWTGSMFSGMPNYQVNSCIPSHYVSHTIVNKILKFGLNETMGIIFAYFLCFFILLRCFEVNPWLSIIGSFAIGLSSYFFLIIPAGHVTKAVAIGLLAPIIGGVHLIFKKNYWIGIPIVLIFGMTSIVRHPQMTYYVGLLISVLVIAEIFILIKEKKFSTLGINLGIIVLCCVTILATKLCWYTLNTEYLAETMRGGHSELKQEDNQGISKGLDIDYATAWSYGIKETLTFLVPNFMGAASGYNVGTNSDLYKGMVKLNVPKSTAKQFCQYESHVYWGEKAFTSGPVYVGAIICFLFVLGLIIVKGPYKWALLVATLFSVFLAWGRNFMPLTEFFYNYVPMYNKFRAVESILIVAEITIPLLAFLAVNQLVKDRQNLNQYVKPICIAAGCTGGICFFLALFGGLFFSFQSSYDQYVIQRVGDQIYDLIVNERANLLKSDAWRSFFFIAFAFIAMIAFVKEKIKVKSLYFILAALILLDMVPVDRRFFGDKDFVAKKDNNRFFDIQPWEEEILKDKSLNYRVLNVATNTFNDARTSYRLNSIGGYHAAKLRRYQDLIEAHISKNNWKVLNMLNTKYLIAQDGIHQNPEAMGCAWFVDQVKFVDTPDEESQELWNLDLKKMAVADKKFSPSLSAQSTQPASIEITNYTPDKLEYKTSSQEDKVCVFSEIYYPGWHLYVDDKETEIGRVNYTLRAATIPAGIHSLRLEFHPKGVALDKISYVIAVLILVLSIASIGYYIYLNHKKNTSEIISE